MAEVRQHFFRQGGCPHGKSVVSARQAANGGVCRWRTSTLHGSACTCVCACIIRHLPLRRLVAQLAVWLSGGHPVAPFDVALVLLILGSAHGSPSWGLSSGCGIGILCSSPGRSAGNLIRLIPKHLFPAVWLSLHEICEGYGINMRFPYVFMGSTWMDDIQNFFAIFAILSCTFQFFLSLSAENLNREMRRVSAFFECFTQKEEHKHFLRVYLEFFPMLTILSRFCIFGGSQEMIWT